MPQSSQYPHLLRYAETLCRSQFGKIPQSVELKVDKRCIVFVLDGLIAEGDDRLPEDPDELYTHLYILLDQFIFPPLRRKVEKELGKIAYTFIDWKSENNQAMISAFFTPNVYEPVEDIYPGKAELHLQISRITEEVQKEPAAVESFWLDDDTVMVIRRGLLFSLEKQIVKKGFNSALRVSKRELELDRFYENLKISDLFGRKLDAAFLDWAFDDDISLLALKLEQAGEPA
ncbi:hypothetical protein QWJ34_18710 [Saccharibacillus sp. CPCC 101409]|uniref:hypothetical protein n=1 Tax=Saccharibacillus sp. CPCC 101409 TaxID=3058041 RepID=UPI0026716756|nr:hypothetical protein [Saccharibacillus sp. CPCC 101409]MDO3411800.1 hypothetical protein [Saccharibacillus sp. CPCC 101409]